MTQVKTEKSHSVHWVWVDSTTSYTRHTHTHTHALTHSLTHSHTHTRTRTRTCILPTEALLAEYRCSCVCVCVCVCVFVCVCVCRWRVELVVDSTHTQKTQWNVFFFLDTIESLLIAWRVRAHTILWGLVFTKLHLWGFVFTEWVCSMRASIQKNLWGLVFRAVKNTKLFSRNAGLIW